MTTFNEFSKDNTINIEMLAERDHIIREGFEALLGQDPDAEAVFRDDTKELYLSGTVEHILEFGLLRKLFEETLDMKRTGRVEPLIEQWNVLVEDFHKDPQSPRGARVRAAWIQTVAELPLPELLNHVIKAGAFNEQSGILKDEGYLALKKAVERNEFGNVRALVEAGVSVLDHEKQGDTPLINTALLNGASESTLQCLRSHGALELGEASLIEVMTSAIAAHQIPTIEQLIDEKPHLIQSAFVMNAAALYGQVDLLERFSSLGANLDVLNAARDIIPNANPHDSEMEYNALMVAILNQKTKAAQWCSNNGVVIPQSLSRDALKRCWIAALESEDAADITLILLKEPWMMARLRTEMQESAPQRFPSPLRIAIQNARVEAMALLIDAGIPTDHMDEDDNNIMTLVAEMDSMPLLQATMTMAVERGIDLKAKNKYGETAFDIVEDIEGSAVDLPSHAEQVAAKARLLALMEKQTTLERSASAPPINFKKNKSSSFEKQDSGLKM